MTDFFFDGWPDYIVPAFVLVSVLAVIATLYRDHRNNRKETP